MKEGPSISATTASGVKDWDNLREANLLDGSS